jgi:PAS domain S-box-containing protein
MSAQAGDPGDEPPFSSAASSTWQGSLDRVLFDNALNAVLLADDQGRYIDANAAACDWLGLTREELLGRRVADLIVPFDADDAPQAQWSRFHHEGRQRGRVQLRRKDGSLLVAEFAAVTHVKPGVHLSVLHDVTERQAMESALREGLARYRAATEDLREREAELRETQRLGRIGSWTWDVATSTLQWSEQRFRQFGIDPTQPAPHHGQALRRLYTPDSWERMKAVYLRLRDEGLPYTLDLEIVRGDGAHRWITAHGEAVHDADGRIAKLRGTSIDITESRLADRQRLEAAARLERAEAVKDAAEQANRAKSEFLSRMSHELRTPLNAILGFSELLQNATPPLLPDQLGYVGHVQTAGRHLLSLINDLLDISRIEIGAMTLHLDDVDVLPVVRDAVTGLAQEARSRGVALSLADGDETPALARADRTRLRQVAYNLISNAIKYNRPGGAVGVHVTNEQAWVQLRVSDNGLGMTADQRAALFRPFDRLGRERSGVGGAGIGLAITQQLVQGMGGRIEVHSVPGEGSEFKVSLPVAR